ncbi:MAG: restriction endonuclease subunit M, partial [Planctomycetota bacterium]
MPAPPEVLELVARFRDHRDSYLDPKYNETQLRREFVDPLFVALGWDVDNRQGYAEAYKEVVHEASIKIGESTKAPDYSFGIGGLRKFFVETKKPSVNINKDTDPAYQLRRYAWSAKLPLSILTDFEELAVYDGRVRPEKKDKASTARTKYITYEEYDDRWEEIAEIFSRDAVLKGSFDKYAESTKKKRGTAEVDDAFLKEIEKWRHDLARNVALRNKELSQRELNFAVQKTIDRIIFLRICEDRGIERYGTLQGLTSGPKIYPRLCELFRKADDRYNSGLFHFNKEKDRTEPPDEWTLALTVDDKVLKEIVKHLYYPESPYEFSVLGADILGQVYEQFLGKVIRLTSGHQAKVEDKPEVKKAGGVYYTPTYIVDYIVENTVGKLVEGREPHEVAARTKTTWKPAKKGRPLKVLDPACGSGSFLIGAYQYLLNWYRDWYTENEPAKHKDRIYQTRHDEWRLTTAERKRILLDHIYGVDIDPQAVEVTKLSLLLKVLEGENQESLEKQTRLFRERALPDLSDNIKCGNSLIGPDFYQGQQLDMFDEEERARINVFDWETEFVQIMSSGGFDAVIGNPPYIRIQTMKEWAPVEVEFYKRAFKSAAKGNYDIYVVFVERGLELLSEAGRLGFILPHKFFNSKYGQPLRRLITEDSYVTLIVHFGHQQIFVGATTYTCLLFLDKRRPAQFDYIHVPDLTDWRATGQAVQGCVPATDVTSDEWNIVIGKNAPLVDRLRQLPLTLGDIAHVFVGLQTSADSVYIMDCLREDGDSVLLYSKALECEWEFEKALVHPVVSGTDVARYSPLPRRQFILFPYEVANEQAKLMEFESISESCPQTAEYLLRNRKVLESRERGKFQDAEWYRFGRSQNLGIQERKKLCVPRLVETLHVGIDELGVHYLDNVDVCGITLKSASGLTDQAHLLGILNSRLTRWYFPFVSAPFRGGWLSANRQFIAQLRMPDAHLVSGDNKRQTDIATHVQQILRLQQELVSTKTSHERQALERQIEATDREIDQLVYELYELTDEEIKIVEEAT